MSVSKRYIEIYLEIFKMLRTQAIVHKLMWDKIQCNIFMQVMKTMLNKNLQNLNKTVYEEILLYMYVIL